MNIAFQTVPDRAYRGAKLIVFVGDKLVSVLRDNKPNIPWPNYWDFPGGGKEDNEPALACALRETQEEIGLSLSEKDIIWSRRYTRQTHFTWFFAAQLDADMAGKIVLGDEGQQVRLMHAHEYLSHEKGIPHFQSRLADFLMDAHPENLKGFGYGHAVPYAACA